MSDMLINAHDARLSIIGYQPEAVKIYWSALPSRLPVYGETLDLSGCEIKAVYADGSEAVVTEYCTFTPTTGLLIPDENSLTVTATYTARSGKALQADEVLPIVEAAYIRIILPRSTPTPKERIGIKYEGDDAREALLEAMGVHPEVWLFWTQGGELAKATKLDVKALPSLIPEAVWVDTDGVDNYVGVNHRRLGKNVTTTRYYSPTDTEELTVATGLRLSAQYTIYGNTLTASAYLELDGVSSFAVYNPPTTYDHTYALGLSMNDVRVIYESGDIETADYFAPFPYHAYSSSGGIPNNSRFFGFYGPNSWIDKVKIGDLVTDKNIYIGSGTHSLHIVLAEERKNIGSDVLYYEATEVTCTSEDGTVTWTGAIFE